MEDVDYRFARSKKFQGFLNLVTEKRMSKAGRFLRIHFKTGAVCDIVPPGSIASGSQLVRATKGKNRWQFVPPELDRLWRNHATVHRKSGKRVEPVTA
jgi:hypothetical protein